MSYLEAIDHFNKTDPILAKIITQIGDDKLIWPMPQSNLLEALTWSIISQQISTKTANKIYHKFKELCIAEHQYLEASFLLQITEEELRKIGISRYKVVYLRHLAQEILNGLPTLSDLETMEDEKIIQILTQIKGIGIWTVQMLLIFVLERLDVLPSGDLAIRQAVKKVYQLPELPSIKTVKLIGEAWKPHRTIASKYLWLSLSLN